MENVTKVLDQQDRIPINLETKHVSMTMKQIVISLFTIGSLLLGFSKIINGVVTGTARLNDKIELGFKAMDDKRDNDRKMDDLRYEILKTSLSELQVRVKELEDARKTGQK